LPRTENLRRKWEGVKAVLYKPSFCCECGEKIEKENLKWWDSPRFCSDCSKHFDKLPNRILKYFVGAMVCTGIGFFIANSMPQRKPPVTIQNQTAVTQQQNANRQTAQANQPAKPQTPAQPVNQPTPQKTPQTLVSSLPQTAPEFAETAETAYYCGAKTQKGAPCTRRVRGGGRCWQHVGKPPMVAQEKLKIPQ
jgi:hypothetical protein